MTFFYDVTNIFDPRRNSGNRIEWQIQFSCNEIGEGGFAHSWIAPKNDRRTIFLFEKLADNAFIRNEFFLTYIVVQALRTHTFCERLNCVYAFFHFVISRGKNTDNRIKITPV